MRTHADGRQPVNVNDRARRVVALINFNNSMKIIFKRFSLANYEFFHWTEVTLSVRSAHPPLRHNEFYQSVYRRPASFTRLASFRRTGHQSTQRPPYRASAEFDKFGGVLGGARTRQSMGGFCAQSLPHRTSNWNPPKRCWPVPVDLRQKKHRWNSNGVRST